MREHRIITFGLSDNQNAVVYANRPQSDYEVFDTDAPTDVIAIGCVAMIINASQMDEISRNSIFELYTDINGCTDQTVIWFGEPKPPANLQKTFKCYNSFDDIEDKIKYLLLNAHSKSKKACEYSVQLSNGLKILNLIRRYPGITTHKLSKKQICLYALFKDT